VRAKARDITVIKCGGNASLDPTAVCADIAKLSADGRKIVLVHGGSAEIERLAVRLEVPMRRLTSPDGLSARFTDAAMLEVVSLAMAGVVQPRLVCELLSNGTPAVGLTGIQGALIRAHRRKTQRALVNGRQVVVRGDHSGRITHVNTDLLDILISAGFVPVISPPVLGEDASALNADADRVAAAVAGALCASQLILLTGAPGVLADPSDPRSVMPVCVVPRTGPPPKRAAGIGVKLLAARDALAAGVPTVLIAGGTGPEPVRRALSGAATRVTLSAAVLKAVA
jgi:[amino group carrier protein]-L-2-aminoadipate 6-kinase